MSGAQNTTAMDVKALLRSEAARLGFESVRVARPDSIAAAALRLDEFLAKDRHGDMDWMEKHAERRRSPSALWPEARSVIMLAISYTPKSDPMQAVRERSRGAISVYAHGRDYHDVVKPKLKELARRLTACTGCDAKVFVDTAPLMEKPLAAEAGIGWQGKHTNLVSRQSGSWLFLGAILTTLDLEPDTGGDDHCGTCRRCLDICPTNAFPQPYVLDARRCISYLTIEHKGHIAPEFRRAIGNRIYGCDDCLAVCPWNKFAVAARESRFHAREELDGPPLHELLLLDDVAFRNRFTGTAIKRTGRDRMLRNVAIAAGNSGDKALIPLLADRLDDRSALVRAMAVWALARLGAQDVLDRRRAGCLLVEDDENVRREWRDAAEAVSS